MAPGSVRLGNESLDRDHASIRSEASREMDCPPSAIRLHVLAGDGVGLAIEECFQGIIGHQGTESHAMRRSDRWPGATLESPSPFERNVTPLNLELSERYQ